MYSGLTTAAGSITAQTIPNYFKDATFGVPSGDVRSTESPEPGVTIVRDKAFGVPHIYGDTREALMFGIGYATAEDRLFFIDVLRHAGQGDLAGFAGRSQRLDGRERVGERALHPAGPHQPGQLGHASRPDGTQIFDDATSYVDGINAYIAKPRTRSSRPRYAGRVRGARACRGPQPFSLEDLVSIATLVGGIFGNGGGDQLSNAVLYENLARRFGHERIIVAGRPRCSPRPSRRRSRSARSTTRRQHTQHAARPAPRKAQRHARPSAPRARSAKPRPPTVRALRRS